MKIDRFTRAVVLLNCTVPVALLGWDAWGGRLGANPVNFAIRTTGILSLIFLVLSLTVTPASRITGWGWLGQFRRMLGLYAFFHAALHFLLFFAFDRAGDVRDTASEMAKRPYLLVGTVGLVLMIPLAATSTNRMIKRLGPARWKALHRLAYLAATAGVLHFYMLVKADTSRPIGFATALGVLFLYRLAAHYIRLRHDARTSRSAPTAQHASRPRPWAGPLKVAQVFDEAAEVRTFRFVSTTGSRLPFDFLPGQYLNLTLSIDGMTVRRSYTIASSPSRAAYCELTIKREHRGLASRHLHDAIREGCVLDVRAPAGKFTFTGMEAESIVLIGGGVGITPLMAKIRYLTDLSWPGDIDLVFCVKTETDIIFRDELAFLARRHPNLRVTITLTRDEGPRWTGERGRISGAMLGRVVPQIADRRVHLCGPTEMVEATRSILRELGVPDGSILVESFTSPSRDPSPVASATRRNAATTVAMDPGTGDASIRFTRSHKSGPVDVDQTVLDAAEALGVSINYDCRAGICGECKVRRLAGHVVMDAEDALTTTDRENDVILSCQARCIDHVEVDA
ncbi:ferric reductase-like transmembrane domain-containing protein [Aquisphaera insulae]|uniref:ferric reductase-like transmembrane domain-containing protein n=1 Tax=Aquisphaera insulae TaxID=2712864 RepID=UPI0013EDCC5A|nr:ferric reductase-like transmembrane domain-containing protein [Aquisphaera insulae]